MRQEAVQEIQRRFNLLLKNATPRTISHGTTGSRIKFHMALNLLGGDMKLQSAKESTADGPWVDITWDWTDEEYNEPILSVEEYHSDEYDSLLEPLFDKLNYTVNKKK
jgi:hypothetical protein